MNRRRHSNEFKMEAVRLAERREIPVSQAAQELGICESLLHKWIKQFGKGSDGVRVSADEHEELIRLRRELRIVKEERDILKKATAFFARQSQ
jgi:transposase